jgi:perosamine synthetase
MSVTTQRPAILGGPKAITTEGCERWQPPIEREIELCSQVIRDRAYSQTAGGIPGEFEQRFREFVGADFCLSQNSGTSALLAAYFAVGVGPGDEVIVPTYTWVASFSPAALLGARPAFCDIDRATLLLDPADVERRLTPRTKAICAVHLFGNVCDMDAIMEIARRHGVAVIEDASHAHGAAWDGMPVGTVGDIGCFSLQGALPWGKPVAGGEGGVVVTSNRHYYERILMLGHLNRAGMPEEITDPQFQGMGGIGFACLKLRAHGLACAVALASMETIEYRNRRMRENVAAIFRGLEGIPGVHPPVVHSKATPAGFHGSPHGVYDPNELGGLSVERFTEALAAEGAPTGGRSYPLYHLQKPWAEGMPFYDDGRGPLTGNYAGYQRGDFPNAEEVHPRMISFPAPIDPRDGFIDEYCAAVAKVASNHRALLA